MIKRQSATTVSAGNSPLAARDEQFERAYPALSEFLTARLFDDGSERETATLLLFAVDGVWKVCLNDRAEGRVAFVSGATTASAMATLDTQLEDGTVEWKVSKPYKSKTR